MIERTVHAIMVALCAPLVSLPASATEVPPTPAPAESAQSSLEADSNHERSGRILYLHMTGGFAPIVQLGGEVFVGAYAQVSAGSASEDKAKEKPRGEFGFGPFLGVVMAEPSGRASLSMANFGVEVHWITSIWRSGLGLRMATSVGASATGAAACKEDQTGTCTDIDAATGFYGSLAFDLVAPMSWPCRPTIGVAPLLSQSGDLAFFMVPIRAGLTF